ncbi:M13 family metallopeptidase [Acidipila sp. EB88]|uniref:M13 family metallopeptidase n=1 Tax=Acidipila sp. EB88 TaxID=2305226 RepID=UPI0013153CBC|nr:M13 family metallopeptidase [Acidipila sp. EB88]
MKTHSGISLTQTAMAAEKGHAAPRSRRTGAQRLLLGAGLLGIAAMGLPAGAGGWGVVRAQSAVQTAGVKGTGDQNGSPKPAPAAPALHDFDPALRDTTADPCTDFYQYACGGWLKAHPIPADRAAYGRDTETTDQNEQVLRTILEKAASGGAARTANQQRIGDAYAACMDTDAINALGTKPLAELLAAVDAVKQRDQLPALLAQLHTKGVSGFFQFGSQQDFRNATQQIATIAQPALGLPEKGYYDRTDGKSAELRTQYVEHVRRTFVLMGEPESQATVDAGVVLRMETKLAAASLSRLEMRDPTKLYHRTPLVQFDANSPELRMGTFLEAMHAPAVQSLNVQEPVYFLELHDSLEAASLEDIKTFLRWVVVRSVPGTALPQPLDDEAFAFYGKVLSGVPEQEPRWKRCAERVDSEVGEALGEEYVKAKFSPEDKARTGELTRAIETAAEHDIDALAWMSAATKTEAKRKLHLVTNHIGYPDTWRDYSSLAMVRTDAFGNALRANAFDVARDVRKIGRPVDRGEWEMTPPTVNAYYNPQMNSINFPAGILQPPQFDPSQDDAVNYGAAGGTIGHELTHGFDDEGRQFDGQGNLRDWWRKDDAKQFAERAECVVNEYDGFVAVAEPGTPELHVNGKLTLGENLADLAGLRLAYLAYMDKAKEAGVSLLTPGDASYGGLTPVQQFFAAYGQSWCESTRPESMRERTEVDPHAPEKYRVNGVVENMPAFAEAFQCKAGAAMVPVKRCAIW